MVRRISIQLHQRGGTLINDKRHHIPFFVQFLLLFQVPKFSHDGDVTLMYKTLFGNIYVLSEITTDKDPA